MITDAQTNTLFLADVLPQKFPGFYSELEVLLKRHQVNFRFLPHSKDIWAVDYMPVQLDQDEFVQFKYNPDYLQPKKWHRTISDGAQIAESLGIQTRNTGIILDGGNVVNANNKVILCDKILKENRSFLSLELISELKSTFRVDEVFLIPQQPGDFIGHADGMIRFIDDNTVLINDFSREKPAYQNAVKTALNATGLIVLPCHTIHTRTGRPRRRTAFTSTIYKWKRLL